MSKYDPTTNGGETRLRTRAINIRTPHDAAYTIEILEQEVIRVAGNGERIINNQAGRIEVIDSADERTFTFPLLSPISDQPLGDATATGEEFLTMLYSFVRAHQGKRDELQTEE